MKALDLLTKESVHGSKTVSALHTLEDNRGMFLFQILYFDKFGFFLHTIFLKKLVLAFAADGHDLFKQFLHAAAVKIIMGFAAEGLQLFLFPAFIKDGFSCLNLKLRHILADLHPLLKELYDLGVNHVDVITHFL